MERGPSCDDPNCISIVVRHDSGSASHHYLRFDRDVDVTDEDGKSSTCRISVAFGLERSTDSDWRIMPLSPGRVCIYFPAVKETSSLRFHVHAPFASTVARDSVRECESNDELRDHLAVLIAESMMDVRRRGHLTVAFLAVLPNESDNVSDYYRPIMTRLVDAFTTQPLLPMKRGSHAAAAGVYRAERRGVSDLIEDHDLALLLGKNRSRHLWIANPPQRNQGADRFLEMLEIAAWGVEDLIKCLSVQSDELELWMKKKPHEWHQRLYALLDEQSRIRRYVPQPAFSQIRVILCADGAYRGGKECYFPDSDGHGEADFPRVDRRVYSSGREEAQQKAARSFLENAGVRRVDEAVRVEAVLKRRYAVPDSAIADDTIKQDMEAFMRLVKKDPKRAGLFKDFFVLDAVDGDDVPSRCKPDQVFIDEPYEATGLDAYHDQNTNRQQRKRRISVRYKQLEVDSQRLVAFADAVGAQRRLSATCQKIPQSHPEYKHLHRAPGNYTSTGTNVDYKIKEFGVLLESIRLDKAKLIWKTMRDIDPSCLKACLRKNQGREPHYADSTLVHELRAASWIPQEHDDGLNFVRPSEASRDLLPAGFPFDQGDKWIKAVEFGKTTDDRSAQARRDGFHNYDEKKQMVKIAEWCRTQGMSPYDVLQRLMRRFASAVPADGSDIRDDWASNPALPNEFGTTSEPRVVLLAIGKWWDRNKDEARRKYDRLVYPQDFDRERLQDEPIDRSAWLTLFALAAFNTLGRTQDAQHRTFIERGWRDGWWQELAESEPPDDVKPWLDRLRAWSGVGQVEEYQLWRRAFVDLYTIVRWLDEYAVVMRKLPRIVAQRDGDPVSLHDVLRPGQSPLLRELGIEAAPLDRTLGIGINWMIREMLRNGTYDAEDEAVMAPYCWMPSRRERQRLLARLRFDDVSDDANSDDSRHIHGFVVEHVGCDHARFDGDFDLPLQLITRKEHTEALNRCFSDGMIGQ